jgi:hypothetical protein
VNRFFRRYGAIAASLIVLFASGIAAGFRWGQSKSARLPSSHSNGAAELTPDQWSENAAAALQSDLDLTPEQTDKIRRSIAGPARQIFEEKHRGNLKIHLRLLEAHDTLARDVELSEKQRNLLKLRREQLKQHILEKFRDLIGDKQDAVLSDL